MKTKFFPKDKRSLFESLIILIFAVIFNQSAYYASKMIATSWYHYDMTLSIDAIFPFVPWTVAIYFGCYLVWAINYYLCTVQDKENRDRFFCADVMSKIICFLIFIIIPTTNIRPEITDEGFWGFMMETLYKIDTPENLFPSIHCLVSWFCWIGVRKRKDVHPLYRYFSLAVAIAVCISTLTTRQHVIVDVFGGVLIAELCYFIAKFPGIRAVYSKFISSVVRIFVK